MAKEKSCGAVVFKKEKDGAKYLLLHYTSGHWDFPKGNQEKDEQEEQTAAREVKEETGIDDLEFYDNFRHVINYYYRRPNGEVVFKEVVFFLAGTGKDEVIISNEHIGYVWASYENAEKKLTFNNAKELLKKANDFLFKK